MPSIKFDPTDLTLIADVQAAINRLGQHLSETSDLSVEWAIRSIDGDKLAGSDSDNGHEMTAFGAE